MSNSLSLGVLVSKIGTNRDHIYLGIVQKFTEPHMETRFHKFVFTLVGHMIGGLD